jgi:hypothetical protein
VSALHDCTGAATTAPVGMAAWAARIGAATPAACGGAIDVPLSQA